MLILSDLRWKIKDVYHAKAHLFIATMYIKGIEGYLIVSWHMINPSMWKFGSLVAIHCQSIGSSVILRWWSICTPLSFHWHSLGSQLVFHWWSIGALKWQANGSQLEIHWHTIDTPIQGYSIGTRVALHWQSNWNSIGNPLVDEMNSIYTQLVVSWYSIGSPLTLKWHSIGSLFALHWHSIDTPIG